MRSILGWQDLTISIPQAVTGKETFIGLGPYPTISPSEARTQANHFRNQVLNGTDPGEKRRAEARQRRR